MSFWYGWYVCFVSVVNFFFKEAFSVVDAVTAGYFAVSYASGFASYG